MLFEHHPSAADSMRAKSVILNIIVMLLIEYIIPDCALERSFQYARWF
jgi:hypothetical protein